MKPLKNMRKVNSNTEISVIYIVKKKDEVEE